jgi:hypothetical protein
MYAGERAANSAANDPNPSDASPTHGDPPPASDAVPAVEVIELANGQTIWFVIFCLFHNYPDQRLGPSSTAYATTTMTSQFIQGAPAVPVSHLSTLLVKMVKVGCRCLSRNTGDPDRRAAIHPFCHARDRSQGNSDPRQR